MTFNWLLTFFLTEDTCLSNWSLLSETETSVRGVNSAWKKYTYYKVIAIDNMIKSYISLSFLVIKSHLNWGMLVNLAMNATVKVDKINKKKRTEVQICKRCLSSKLPIMVKY